jgi:predicted O-linked N-acetylglucosamine transferase (SPINDLY family)
MNYMEEYSVGDILEESHKWGALYVKKELVKSETYGNVPDPERRLRIGYVSKDFGRHPVGYFLLPVLSSHDHASVEVYCYSGRIREDDVTGRLRESADVWRSTTDLDDRDLASMVRDDSIDILVDLSGHTGGSRLLVFAEKPAPIQVSWAGYAGTTGLSTMDYLISDWRETPEGSDRWYVEKVVRLPDCYVCYEPPEYAPPVVPLPALKKGHVTFGCFNNLAKVRPGVVALWSKILREIPNARLLMITKQLSDPDTRRRYLEMFSAGGVGERVDLSGDRPHIDLLAGYGEIDIALDPFPYSGGLTTLESLWMGVPVITLGGDRFASRHSLSHLTAVGLPELIASGPDDYIARAVGLACDPERLATLRRELRPRMAASPLCDGSRFTRNLEDAYRYMWRSWCAGKIHRLKTM